MLPIGFIWRLQSIRHTSAVWVRAEAPECGAVRGGGGGGAAGSGGGGKTCLQPERPLWCSRLTFRGDDAYASFTAAKSS